MSKILVLVVGLGLTMIGVVLLMYQDVTITTHAQKVLEVGPLQATTEQTRSTIPVSPIIGGVLALAGVTAVFIGAYTPRVRRQKEAKPEKVETADAGSRHDRMAS